MAARIAIPYPVPIKVYDETIRVMKSAVLKAKLGREAEMQALKRLDNQACQLEAKVEGRSLELYRGRACGLVVSGRQIGIRLEKGSNREKGCRLLAAVARPGGNSCSCSAGAPPWTAGIHPPRHDTLWRNSVEETETEHPHQPLYPRREPSAEQFGWL